MRVIPISLLLIDYEIYNIRDYETSYIDHSYGDYPDLHTQAERCIMNLSNLSEGMLIISFYQQINWSMVTKVYLTLFDEEGKIIWEHSGMTEGSFGLFIKNREQVSIKGGSYVLEVVCDNIEYLGLRVYYSANSNYLTSSCCCCGTSSIMVFSIFLMVLSITRKKKNEV